VDDVPDIVPTTPDGLHLRVARGVDRVLSVQRPVVLAHLRSIRRSRPDASPEEVLRILERRYLAAVTSGGALVGASSAIPAVGVGASLALSGVETAGFLEASALFAQSVTELHGIAVVEPERARALVMTMIMGGAGQDLLTQFAAQAAGGGVTRPAYWGELITRSLPSGAVRMLGDRIKGAFLKRFASSQGAGIVGRAIPFGIGAAIGGVGNHVLGRRVVQSARGAFGPVPPTFPSSLIDPGLPRRRRAPRRSRRELPAAEDVSLAPRELPPAPPPPDPTTRRPQ